MTHNTKVVFPYEKEEQEKLVTAFTEEKNGRLRFRYGWGAVLILETGLRAGEALALEWRDIDEGKRTLKVNKNMVRVDGKNTVQRTTKTESGKRTIPLNARAMDAIRHLKEQRIIGCSFVFATQTGRHLSYRNLLATMETACEAAGVEHRGLHALRHSFASNLYARGVEVKIISNFWATPASRSPTTVHPLLRGRHRRHPPTGGRGVKEGLKRQTVLQMAELSISNNSIYQC